MIIPGQLVYSCGKQYTHSKGHPKPKILKVITATKGPLRAGTGLKKIKPFFHYKNFSACLL
jgi:hypothetical protein